MTRLLFSSLVIVWLAAVVAAAPQLQVNPPAMFQTEQSPPTSPVRRAQMDGHYRAVVRVYDAVIAGDLEAARTAAIDIWGMPTPSGMPAGGVQIADWVQRQGRRVAQATSLDEAARASAAMLTLCGDCHATVGVRIATAEPPRPDVGGIVGHMLGHQRAVEALVEGLVAPSSMRWRAGADLLGELPLDSDELPDDPGLTAAVRRAEAEVHAVSVDAIAAPDNTTRTAVFGRLIGTCAGCHQLHAGTWGPAPDPR